MEEAIRLENVTKTYKIPMKEEGVKGSLKSIFHRKYQYKTAVHSIDLTIHKGEFIGFIGPNGAGKTTTIKMLSGIIYPDAGNISVLGYVPQQLKNEFKKKFSVIMGQKSQLWWDIPAIDSFNMIKEIYEIPEKTYRVNVDELTEIMQIKQLMNVPVRNLSLGERMKMELIACLLHDPEVIFLDEPTIGLDVFTRRRIRDFLKIINMEKKKTIILTSHYIEDIKALCSRIVAIQKGKIIFDGPFDQIAEEYVDNKQVTVTFDSPSLTERLMPYGQLLELGRNRAVFIVNRNRMKEFCAAFFSEEDYLDIKIEDMPVDEVFEMLFKAGGKEIVYG